MASKQEVESKEENYLTFDNGGRNFLVTIKNNIVKVYKKTDLLDETNTYDKFDILVLTIDKPLKIFIGQHVKDNFDQNLSDEWGLGNSILIEVESFSSKRKYIHIGVEIFSFETPSEIIQFSSIVGNSCSPYPYAIDCDNRAYLFSISDKEKISYNWDPSMKANTHWFKPNDPYHIYYSQQENMGKDISEWKKLVMFSKMDIIKIEERPD